MHDVLDVFSHCASDCTDRTILKQCWTNLHTNSSYNQAGDSCLNQFNPDSHLTVQDQFMLENPACVLNKDCTFERCFQAGRRFELVRILLGLIFITGMNLLILNLLIAYFTTSYESVRARSEGLWAHHRTLLVSDYYSKNYALTNTDTVIYYGWRLPKNFICHIFRFLNRDNSEKKVQRNLADFFKPTFRKFSNVPSKIEKKELIKFEKILAYEVTDMIEFHQFALKENEDKEFNRREEMELLMATLKEIREFQMKQSIESTRLNRQNSN